MQVQDDIRRGETRGVADDARPGHRPLQEVDVGLADDHLEHRVLREPLKSWERHHQIPEAPEAHGADRRRHGAIRASTSSTSMARMHA